MDCKNSYLQVLLGSQNFSDNFASFHTQGVAKQPDLLNIVGSKILDMRLDIRGGIELEALAFNGKQLVENIHIV